MRPNILYDFRILAALFSATALLAVAPAVPAQQPLEDVPDDPPSIDTPANDTEGSDQHLVPIEDISLLELLAAPIVQSASRRLQSFFDAPSSVTVVEGDEIREMGVRNPAEILRRVVGAYVVGMSANEYEVGLRGRITIANNRTLILLDGRTTMDLVVARSPWAWLPVHPSEIERIEVVRGPGATLYGSNASNGVISITTRRPLDYPGIQSEVTSGVYFMQPPQDSDDNPNIENDSWGYAAYNWANPDRTLGARMSLGFRQRPELTRGLAIEPIFGNFGYDARLGFDVRPEGTDMQLYLTASQSRIEYVSTLSRPPAATVVSEQAFTADFAYPGLLNDLITLRAVLDSTHLDIEAAPNSENWSHHGIGQIDLGVWDGRNILTVGGEISFVDATDYGGFAPRSLGLSLIVQDELRLLAAQNLVFNLGVRFETFNYDDGESVETTYGSINPRLSAIWRPVEDQSLRFTAATSNRNPVATEVSVGTPSAPGEPDAPTASLLVPNPHLEAEEVQSLELGYRGDFNGRVLVDLVFYLQRVNNVVDIRLPADYPLIFDNVHTRNTMGVEASIEMAFTESVRSYINYTGTRTRIDETGASWNMFAPHILGLGLSADLTEQLSLYTSGYFAFGVDTYALNLSTGGAGIELGKSAIADQIVLDLRLAHDIFDGMGEVFLLTKNFLGFFRDPADLVQWESSFALPIGASFLIGMQIDG